MKLSVWLGIAAVLAGVFGLGLVLVTGPMLSLYGIALDKAGTVVAQLFGAALIGFALINWFARNATDGEARGAIVLGNLVGDVAGFMVALIGQLAGVANVLGWSAVAIYLLLSLGFAYFQFMKPASA